MLSPSAILDADAPVGEVIALPNESDSLSVNECVTTALTVTLPSIPSPATTAAAWSNAPGTTVYVTGLPPGPIATPSCRTVTEYVRELRLQACHEALVRGGPQVAVGTLCYEWGFSDQSHFTRMFKRRFGVAPGEARRLAVAGRA